MVIGTVIDESLGDELMVTVVATGLGAASKPKLAIENAVTRAALAGNTNFPELESPTFKRRQMANADRPAAEASDKEIEYLDVPAFLRRQAD